MNPAAEILEGRREGAYVYDQAGRRYVDGVCSAGTFNLGRRRPELIEELKQALRETDLGNFPMISKEKALLAKALSDFVPGDLECSIFGVTRGEAIDAACKIARGSTGRPGLIAMGGAWHGQTGFALSLSQREDKDSFGPLVPEVTIVPFGDVNAIEQMRADNVAAIVAEPIQAENHCRAWSDAYALALDQARNKYETLLVVDETQTGFGRTGTKFAFEVYGIKPDILVLGEALGGGVFPIVVTMLTQQVNTFLNKHPLIHLSTFGGADIGCRVAKRALEIYEQVQPWRNAAAMGERLIQGIGQIIARGGSPIRGVAGKGLLLSLDLGSPEDANAFCDAAVRHGLLVIPGEVAKHAVVLRPSLLITESETDEILAALRAASAEP